jgi:CheY-like chemotaxis protein
MPVRLRLKGKYVMLRILIIEDDLNTRKGLVDLLCQEGYGVVGVRRGREAFEVIANASIDVVLCDYKLPEMDGLNVCLQLRRQQPRLKLFLITAYNSAELVKAVRACGIVKIFNKPLDLDDLFATLQALPPATDEKALCASPVDPPPVVLNNEVPC